MKRNASIFLLLACLTGFVLGLLELFELRFAAGDVYPPYSSLRSDPLGASALYESLARLPGLSVSRDFQSTDKLPDGKGTTYLQFAGDPADWEELPAASFKEIEAFLYRGGRLVITLVPETEKPGVRHTFGKTSPEAPKAGKKDGEKARSEPRPGKREHIRERDDPFSQMVQLKERWGFDLKFVELERGDGESYKPVAAENHTEPSLPADVSWHSALVFTGLNQNWRVIYERGPQPVLIERKFGAGSVVIATDPFFVSNEALQKERHASLLAWLTGDRCVIVFDEAHFGIVESAGVATLIRHYRLHGLVAGLLLLAGLFIWKNSAGLVPVQAETLGDEQVLGKDAAAGLVNLLRRHVPSQEVLNVCFEEWQKLLPRDRRSASRLAAVKTTMAAENSLPLRERNPVRAYQAIYALLKRPAGVAVPNSEPNQTQ